MMQTPKPRPATAYNHTSRDVSKTDNDTCTSLLEKVPDKGDLSDDFDTWFEWVNGTYLVNVKRLAREFGKTEDHCNEIITRNRELFKGDHFEFTRMSRGKSDNAPIQKRKRGRPQKDHYLTRDGCLTFVNRLDYNRYDPEISVFIIRFQKWLIKTAADVIDGNVFQTHVRPVLWKQERKEATSNEKLCMEYVKKYEVPKQAWRNPRDPYQRENREVNVDTIGVHIRGLSDKLNENGLQIKNEAYSIDMALMEAGIDFEPRHQIIKHTLNTTHPKRQPENLLLSIVEQERIRKQLPASQTGISDFMAVTA